MRVYNYFEFLCKVPGANPETYPGGFIVENNGDKMHVTLYWKVGLILVYSAKLLNISREMK